MKKIPIEREAIFPRIDGMTRNIQKLSDLSKLSLEDFMEGDGFDLAQHHLRLALEGVFHISSHLLSRLPGGRAVEYKEVARKMGELKLVPLSFAVSSLVPMAGMRNILVHAYADIKPEKLLEIIQNHREDIEQFLQYIKIVVEDPSRFNLKIS